MEKPGAKSFSDLSAGQVRKILAEEGKANKLIDKQLKDDAEAMRNKMTILLLGAGEAGKSTVIKQMRIIYTEGFSEIEAKTFIAPLRSNVLTAMVEIVKCAERLGFDFGELKEVVEKFKQNSEYPAEYSDAVEEIRVLVKSTVVEMLITRVHELNLPDYSQYVIQNFDRIDAPDFVPNQDDILRARQMTTGIVEHNLPLFDYDCKVIDVAGQRNQRRKWIHFFDNVDLVIFVASIADYNLPLKEDPTTNALQESLSTTIVLFLNKEDIFNEKIKYTPLTSCFSEYEPPEDSDQHCDHAKEYIMNQFLLQKSQPSQRVRVHFTCATDPQNLHRVWNAVRDLRLD